MVAMTPKALKVKSAYGIVDLRTVCAKKRTVIIRWCHACQCSKKKGWWV